MRGQPTDGGEFSLAAIRKSFDENVVAQHLEAHHGLEMSVGGVFDALHTLSQQTYENKSLTFGCILDPALTAANTIATFPGDFIASKKYKALSDGFRTAYHVAANGGLHDFVDLERFDASPLTEKHYYPDWAKPLAKASRDGRCGIGLSRQGDILVFDEGTLRFTYRYGRWQY